MMNFDHVAEIIEGCMDEVVAARSFKDTTNVDVPEPLGSQIIASLSCIFFEYVVSYLSSRN
jgi:hypothetical protein